MAPSVCPKAVTKPKEWLGNPGLLEAMDSNMTKVVTSTPRFNTLKFGVVLDGNLSDVCSKMRLPGGDHETRMVESEGEMEKMRAGDSLKHF